MEDVAKGSVVNIVGFIVTLFQSSHDVIEEQ